MDLEDPGRSRPPLLPAFWQWLRRDFILRRLALLLSGLCMLFIFGYILLHVVMLAPVFLLAVLCFAYGISGRERLLP